MSIAQQMSQCCCNVREAITNSNYQNQIATINSVNALSNQIGALRTGMDQGFSSNAYETQAQTCAINNNISSSVQSIKDTATVNTNSILAKLDQMQNSALQDRINELQETKTRLQNQISQEQQNQAVAAMIAPLQKELAEIKQNQPSTTTVQYPNLVAVPASQYYNSGTTTFWT